MIDPKNVSGRIEIIRRQNHLTQDQLAAELKLSQAAVSKYLNNRIPSADALLKLARLGNTSIEWILTGEGHPGFSRQQPHTVREPQAAYGSNAGLSAKLAELSPRARAIVGELVDLLLDQGK